MNSVLEDILSEPQVIEDTLTEGRIRLPRIAALLQARRPGSIHAFGAGSSHFIAQSGRYAIEGLAGIRIQAHSSMDFLNYGLRTVEAGDTAIAISQSGETFETIEAARAAVKRGCLIVALTNDEDSTLAALAHDVLLIRAGKEVGPGTKTVVAQGTAMHHLALHLAFAHPEGRNLAAELAELESAPRVLRAMLSGECAAEAEKLAALLHLHDHLYLVGAGPLFVLALQAANLLGEVGRLWCHPHEATEYRHGPLEAVSARAIVMFFAAHGSAGDDQLRRACSATAGTGASMVYVGDAGSRPKGPFALEFILPELSELLAAHLYLSPLQLVAVRVAEDKGFDPVRFVNIVKTWRA